MFVGRDYQLKLLSSVWDKEFSSLVVVSGRRRIGKSTLIERFAEKYATVYATITPAFT